MRICDLIKQHTNTGPLVHLCEVRLQRMRRRREPASHVPCLLCGNQRRKRRVYTWCCSPVIEHSSSGSGKMTIKNIQWEVGWRGVAVYDTAEVWKILVLVGYWIKLWKTVLMSHNPCKCTKQSLWSPKKERNEKSKEAKREVQWDSKRAERILRLLEFEALMAFRCVQRLLYFQRSIKHSLSEEFKQRQEFMDWKFWTAVTTKCLSLMFTHVTYIFRFTSTDSSIVFKSSFMFGFHTFLLCWSFLSGTAAMSIGGWVGWCAPCFLCKPWGSCDLDEVR